MLASYTQAGRKEPQYGGRRYKGVLRAPYYSALNYVATYLKHRNVVDDYHRPVDGLRLL